MAWAPEPTLRREDIGRIVYGVDRGEWHTLRDRPGYREPIMLGGHYSYVTETMWELIVGDAERRGDDDLTERLSDARNPREVRPWMLERNHRLR